MSSISALSSIPELNFIDNLTLDETEELIKTQYAATYRELTGADADFSDLTILALIKSFALIQYQSLQYINTMGRSEMLNTATGDSLDAIAALHGITRNEASRATATVRFTASELRSDAIAISAGTRVKTQTDKYFNTVTYAEIAVGSTYVDVTVQAGEAGLESNDVRVGDIDILVDPIPYITKVSNTTASAGGTDTESDDDLTERLFNALSKYACAGPKEAYEYHVREWRSDVEEVKVVSPEAGKVALYVTLDGGKTLTSSEQTSLLAYMSSDSIRPLTDNVVYATPTAVNYAITLTYWIGTEHQNQVSDVQQAVTDAVNEYKAWQRRLGRDINPTELIYRIRAAGAKRVTVTAPVYTVVTDLQMPNCTAANVTYGGLEDD